MCKMELIASTFRVGSPPVNVIELMDATSFRKDANLSRLRSLFSASPRMQCAQCMLHLRVTSMTRLSKVNLFIKLFRGGNPLTLVGGRSRFLLLKLVNLALPGSYKPTHFSGWVVNELLSPMRSHLDSLQEDVYFLSVV